VAILKRWLLVLLLLLIGCGRVSHQVDAPIAVGSGRTLRGTDLGVAWEKADAQQKLTYCTAEAKSFKSRDSSGFSNSVKNNSLTPEKLCREIDQYYSGKGTGGKADQLGQAVRFVLLTLSKSG
jgi:hypothetical protein